MFYILYLITLIYETLTFLPNNAPGTLLPHTYFYFLLLAWVYIPWKFISGNSLYLELREQFLPEKIYFDSWKLGHATNMAPFSLKFLLGHFHPERLGTRNSRKAGLWPSVLREDSLVPLPRAHNEKSMFLAGTLPLEIWSPPPPPPLPFSVSLRAQSVWSLALDSVLWFNFPHCPGPKLGLLFPEGTATKIKPL